MPDTFAIMAIFSAIQNDNDTLFDISGIKVSRGSFSAAGADELLVSFSDRNQSHAST